MMMIQQEQEQEHVPDTALSEQQIEQVEQQQSYSYETPTTIIGDNNDRSNCCNDSGCDYDSQQQQQQPQEQEQQLQLNHYHVPLGIGIGNGTKEDTTVVVDSISFDDDDNSNINKNKNNDDEDDDDVTVVLLDHLVNGGGYTTTDNNMRNLLRTENNIVVTPLFSFDWFRQQNDENHDEQQPLTDIEIIQHRQRMMICIRKELQVIQKETFILFALFTIIPLGIFLIVSITILFKSDTNGTTTTCISTASHCELEPRKIRNAFTTQCICQPIPVPPYNDDSTERTTTP